MADITPTQQRLSVEAFYRLYPESNQPIELIHGEVVMSPAPKDLHSDLIANLLRELFTQIPPALGKIKTAPADIHLEKNIVQPDIFFVAADNTQCKRESDGYLHGAPDLVVEIVSPGSARTDRVTKFDLYQAHGVREYWLVEPEGAFIEVYALEGEKFTRHGAYTRGETLTSRVLPTLQLPLDAVFPPESLSEHPGEEAG